MTPADHRVRSVKVLIVQLLKLDQVTQIFSRDAYGYNQTNMDAVCLDKYVNSFWRRGPFIIRRN